VSTKEDGKLKILLAGASGVVGRKLHPLLSGGGHEVVAITRRVIGNETLKPGFRWRSVDVYDRRRIDAVLAEENPDVVIHQMTDLREQNLQSNAKLRTVGTRNLVDAALAAGVRFIVAQSIAWAYAPGGNAATEETPLDVDATAPRRTTIDGVVALESAVAEIDHHVILRYGTLYGPGTWYARDGSFARKVQAGEVRAATAVTNFLHVEDAAIAAVQALDWPSGAINIVDDSPAKVSAWLPAYAKELSAELPEIELMAADWSRPVSNAYAHSLGWRPKHPTWRRGFL
jgi:nucleoside-diphosphate-sugar epimerase